MKTPAQRIAKYIVEHGKMSGLDPERIHGFHTGHKTREIDLTISDLRALLAERESMILVLEKAVDSLETWQAQYDPDHTDETTAERVVNARALLRKVTL